MNQDVRSMIVGTAGLSVAAVAALLLTICRDARSSSHAQVGRVQWLAALAIILQCAHFLEEWHTGFQARFPRMFGLAPWPTAFFVSFNLFCIAIWVLCVLLLRSLPRIALFPIWFLGIASVANGVVHPLLALTAGGYFPGLWTSALVGIAGLLVLFALVSYTRPSDRCISS